MAEGRESGYGGQGIPVQSKYEINPPRHAPSFDELNAREQITVLRNLTLGILNGIGVKDRQRLREIVDSIPRPSDERCASGLEDLLNKVQSHVADD